MYKRQTYAGEFDWSKAGKLAEGTRRAIRVPVEQISYQRVEGIAHLGFVLPTGSYATVLLGEIHKGQGIDRGAKPIKIR